MQNQLTSSRPHLTGLLAGLFLAAGLALAAFILAHTWARLAEASSINVTGSARKNIRSDLAIWRAKFSADAPTLLEAHQKLKGDLQKIEAWLARKNAGERLVLAVQIQEITGNFRDRDDDEVVTRRIGYRLTQQVEVRSTEVDRAQPLIGEATELLQQGVTFVPEHLEFIYTKSGEAKIELMAEATKDARARAEQIATQGSRRIKELRTAHMGVVQINPLHSSSTSWEGNSDRSSLEKTLTATVTASFSLQR